MEEVKKIIKIQFNWHQISDGKESGEDFDTITVGKNGCKEIVDFSNDNYICFKSYLEDGTSVEIYNPNLVFYSA